MKQGRNQGFHQGVAAVLVAVFLTTFSGAAFGWGSMGHRLVARIAEKYLDPSARTAICELLQGASMADVANWADAIKKDRPETAPFHYIDFPEAARQPMVEEEREGKLTQALRKFRGIIRDTEAPKLDRREALKFFIHFMGDVHQPLHCAPRGDHGGNDIPVQYMDEESNLHKVWDSGLIRSSGLSEDDYLSALLAELGTIDAGEFDKGTYRDWAAESNTIARFHSYLIPEDHQLDERYYEANIRSVNRQMLKAGVRLANQLNELFAPKAPNLASREIPPDLNPGFLVQ